MATYRAPGPFVPGTDPATAWDLWREEFSIFAAATELSAKSIDVQINTFLHVVGSDARRTYNTLTLPQRPATAADPDTRSLVAVYDAFATHYEPYRNLTVLRHRFASTRQDLSQPFDVFITNLKTQATLCAYGALTDSLVCTQLVVGIADNAVRAKLLAIPTLDLPQAITLCRAAETSVHHASAISAPRGPPASLSDSHLDAVHFSQRGRSRYRSSRSPLHAPPGSSGVQWRPPNSFSRNFSPAVVSPPPRRAGPPSARSYPTRSSSGGTPSRDPCYYCGLVHDPLPSRCPARGTTCSKCGRLNHWANVCKSAHALVEHASSPTGHYAATGPVTQYHDYAPTSTSQNCAPTELHHDDRYFAYTTDPYSDGYAPPSLEEQFNTFTIASLTLHATQSGDSDWYAVVFVADQPIRFKLDSGSQINAIPADTYRRLSGCAPLRPTTFHVSSYSGHSIPMLGTVDLPCASANASMVATFYVTQTARIPILGAKACESLGLVVRLHDVSLASATDASS